MIVQNVKVKLTFLYQNHANVTYRLNEHDGINFLTTRENIKNGLFHFIHTLINDITYDVGNFEMN